MSNNRSFINNGELVRYTQLLDKGLPLPFLEGKYQVDEGWCAVITVGGAYKEILQAGTHFLGHYQMFRELRATAVDMREKSMTVSTQGEFNIAQPVPVEIDLDLQIEYRVADPKRVALEVTTPLTGLFDRVIQAVRGSVVNASVDEIRTRGEGISRETFQKLQAMDLPSALGLQVLNVIVTRIKATDAGQDALAQVQMGQFTAVQDWRVQNAILQQTQVTPQWLMINRPELYAQLVAGNTEVVKELLHMGINPESLLNQPTQSAANDPARLLQALNPANMVGTGLTPPGAPATPQASPQSSSPLLGGPADIHARMREEIKMLEKLPGAKVKSEAGTDDRGVVDGSYGVIIRVPRTSGGSIELRVACSASYPRTPPEELIVLIDGELTPFQSGILRRWTGQYLIELVREVGQHFD